MECTFSVAFCGSTPWRVVCEVQLFHTLMMKARSQLGGHKDYESYRSINEILEYNAANMPGSAAAQTANPQQLPTTSGSGPIDVQKIQKRKTAELLDTLNNSRI